MTKESFTMLEQIAATADERQMCVEHLAQHVEMLYEFVNNLPSPSHRKAIELAGSLHMSFLFTLLYRQNDFNLEQMEAEIFSLEGKYASFFRHLRQSLPALKLGTFRQ